MITEHDGLQRERYGRVRAAGLISGDVVLRCGSVDVVDSAELVRTVRRWGLRRLAVRVEWRSGSPAEELQPFDELRVLAAR